MKIWNRLLVSIASLAVASIGIVAPAHAQSYPPGDLHLIVGFPPGSGADIFARFFGNKLAKNSGRTVIVENKPGAGGALAAQYVSKAKPDGLTILMLSGAALAINFHLVKDDPFDPRTGLTAVSSIFKGTTMLAVKADKPWKNVAELAAYLKAKPDKPAFASVQPSGKIMGYVFLSLLGVDGIDVAYRQPADTLDDMARGLIDFGVFEPTASMIEHQKGTLRILAVGTPERLKAAAEFPTMTEQGYPMDMTGWMGIFLPPGAPKHAATQLNEWMNKSLSDQDAVEFIAKSAGDPWINTPEQVTSVLKKDVEDYAKHVVTARMPKQ